MSPYGAYHGAGNVSEQLLNRYDPGYTTAGCGWSDPIYSFGHTSRGRLSTAMRRSDFDVWLMQ